MNAKERAAWRHALDMDLELQIDLNQRFLNALLAMAVNYPGWMMWVERNLPRQIDKLYEEGAFRMYLQLVESMMRWRFFKPHGFFGRGVVSEIMFNEKYIFTEHGSLRMW